MATAHGLDGLRALTGTDLGYSDWLEVTQDRVNLFADASGDHRWIHTDPERAKDGPFGGAIAHGYLTLSLIVPLFEGLLEITGVRMGINYGLEKVRFPSPVRVGTKIRAGAVVAAVDDLPGTGVQLTVDVTVEADGSDKPACVARAVYRYYA